MASTRVSRFSLAASMANLSCGDIVGGGSNSIFSGGIGRKKTSCNFKEVWWLFFVFSLF